MPDTFTKKLLTAASAIALSLSMNAGAAEQQRNVIFVLMDDLEKGAKLEQLEGYLESNNRRK